jgi:serine/threonine protein kinase
MLRWLLIFMANFDGWETFGDRLGKGGQGEVFKARRPERVRHIQGSLKRIADGFIRLSNVSAQPLENLIQLIVDVGGPDNPKDLGAVKIFEIPTSGPEREKAIGRLKTEINALTTITNPAVLKLLHHSEKRNFIVTEFYPLGALSNHLGIYRGRPLKALLAFKPLVEGIALIHKQGAIHRDIKTENIFVATDGRLVLADFGIVFFADEHHTRLTEIQGERVGSHFWMAPWVYAPARVPIDEIKPALDLFPLGKVLWSMIAGINGFPYWEFDRPENDLVKLFPDDPAMRFVNYLLSKCIVREEADCVQDAGRLLSLVDEAIRMVRNLDRKSDGDLSWRCLVCGKGYYQQEKWFRWHSRELINQQGNAQIMDGTAYSCNNCGHVQFFIPLK